MVTKRTQLVSSMLSIDRIDENVYRSEGPHIGGIVGENRLFGGYIAAQVYDAVRKYKKKMCDVDERLIFSMHYNFLAAGDPLKQIDIKIKRLSDVYAVDIYHENKNIGLAHVKVDKKLMESPPYPEGVPALTSIPHMDKLLQNIPVGTLRQRYTSLFKNVVFEIRPQHIVTSPGPGDYRVIYYARLAPDCIDVVNEDGGMVAVVALSDFFVMQSTGNALLESGFRMGTGASLHHKIYFHQERVEAIQWFLVETRTEIATGNKAKIFGAVFDSNKNCVVSFIQEAYVVPKELNPNAKL
ncbi:unnamed protein product [Caenorhabditis sp. 36 PRJEB53466]|nr:unnamed protein product [Caenorhabditis sp. 36 PRJEB53466]